jgi:hypothetical protein
MFQSAAPDLPQKWALRTGDVMSGLIRKPAARSKGQYPQPRKGLTRRPFFSAP